MKRFWCCFYPVTLLLLRMTGFVLSYPVLCTVLTILLNNSEKYLGLSYPVLCTVLTMPVMYTVDFQWFVFDVT